MLLQQSPPATSAIESMGKVCLLSVDENILIALAFVAIIVLMFVAVLQPPMRRRSYYC
ncbi:unnamed protein product [Urochloa decumbens]|uniref:Uncharacterized protein n=1 Tax=Urochloa decumbens TaxID=240449 RepID=A0ABC8YWB8_9POAL